MPRFTEVNHTFIIVALKVWDIARTILFDQKIFLIFFFLDVDFTLT